MWEKDEDGLSVPAGVGILPPPPSLEPLLEDPGSRGNGRRPDRLLLRAGGRGDAEQEAVLEGTRGEEEEVCCE